VIGTEESVRGMTRDRLADFHARHYVPSRSVLSVAGNVAHADVLAAVSEAYGTRLDGSTEPWRRHVGEVPADPSDRLAVRDEDTEQAHLMLGVPSLRRGDERWAVLQVLSTVLGGGMSSRLFQQVREERGLAYSVYSATTGYTDTGTLAVYVGCAPERLGAAAAVVRDELGDLAAHGITDAELTRARGQLRGELVLGLEESGSRMTRLGRRELDHGGLDRAGDLAGTLERIDAVEGGAVAALASELLTGPRVAAVVGPYGDADELPGEVQEMVEE
jgi:predicted Zn-dependent peptidase